MGKELKRLARISSFLGSWPLLSASASMVFAETPETKAMVKLAPVMGESLPVRISGRASAARWFVHLSDSIRLAATSPSATKNRMRAKRPEELDPYFCYDGEIH